MKIYAIRDRLIDYWMTPFAAPDNGAVMQSIAATINNPSQGDTNAVAYAPHHFEIHQIGYVTEDGHLVPERAFICDCASLVRKRVREEPGHAGSPTAEIAAEARRGPLGGPESRTGADDRPVPGETPPARLAGGKTPGNA